MAASEIELQQQNFDHMCECWRKVLLAAKATMVDVVVAPWPLPAPSNFQGGEMPPCQHGTQWYVCPSFDQQLRWSTPEGRDEWHAAVSETPGWRAVHGDG